MSLWELSHERSREDGLPIQVGLEFSATLHESGNLRPFLVNWRGKSFTPAELTSFDMSKLVNQACMLSIAHEKSGQGRTFAKVKSASQLPKGMPVPRAEADTVYFEIESDDDPPQSLPPWIRRKIDMAAERAGRAPSRGFHGGDGSGGSVPGRHPDDDDLQEKVDGMDENDQDSAPI